MRAKHQDYGALMNAPSLLSRIYMGQFLYLREQTRTTGNYRSSANGGSPWLREDYLTNQLLTPRKRVKNPALLFVLEATVVIGLIVLVGLSGENIGSHTVGQKAETSNSQN